MSNAIKDTNEKLILKPKFSKAKSFEDLRDLLELFDMEIVVDVCSTKSEWLNKISVLERKGLVDVVYDTVQVG